LRSFFGYLLKLPRCLSVSRGRDFGDTRRHISQPVLTLNGLIHSINEQFGTKTSSGRLDRNHSSTEASVRHVSTQHNPPIIVSLSQS